VADEIGVKRQRLSRLCHDAGLAGVILVTQTNFSWLTGGRTNRIDGSRDLGAGALLVAADGRLFVLANAIEMPRLAGEELVHLAPEAIEYAWADEHAAPDMLVRLARSVLGSGARIGADWMIGDAVNVERDIARARVPLTVEEVDRYRALGRDVARAVEAACRRLEPGMSELEVSRRACDAAASVDARAVVSLVAADDRLAKFRHPVPTAARWQRTVMVAQCAQRRGLIVALSRIVCVGEIDAELEQRTRATACVFGALLDATRPGATGAAIFAAATAAYARCGYPGEERKHHQGGATGYRSREWVAHPVSEELVRPPQAFAWNPSITGSKVEDTALVSDDRLELITVTGEWPSIPIAAAGQTLSAAGVLQM
jgi:Xaa-Pro aminopeptidase